MKLATILSFVAAVAALPAAKNDLAARASYSKVDGLRFNIDGVTKCKSNYTCFYSADFVKTTPVPIATGSRSSPMTTMSMSSWVT